MKPGERCYRRLLLAYPRRFREEVGAEMAWVFRQRDAAVRARGRTAVARLWVRTLADLLRNAPAEHLSAAREDWRRRGTGPQRSSRRDPMDALLQDLHQAWRTLRERPGLSAVAVLTIALGVGGNTAVFSIVNAMLFRPLPFPDPDRVVLAWVKTPATSQSAASYPEFEDWKAQSRSFADLAVWRGQSVNLTGSGEPERLVGNFVTDNFFPLLGARAALGRTFLPGETTPGSKKPVAVLSDAVWKRRFGSDRAILGRSLTINGTPVTVVGILGPELSADRAPADGWFLGTEVYLPVPFFPNAKGLLRGQSEMLVVGRLRPGVTPREAETELTTIARRLEQQYPDTQAGRSAVVVRMHDQLVEDARPTLYVLMGAMVLVLLIACANVANLLLARTAQRQREMAVRAAMGAGRGRLVRQLLTENLLLAGLAAAAGLLLGQGMLSGLLAVLPPGTGVPGEVRIDGTVLAFALALTGVTALLFGLAPAAHASRPDLGRVLREASRGLGGGDRSRLRDLLVVSEVAVSLVLLIGAGLLLQSALALQRTTPGFGTDRLLTLEFRLPAARYDTPDKIAPFLRNALARLQAVPGIESVALARAVPFSGNGGVEPLEVEGQAPPPSGQEPGAQTNIVSPGYFQTLSIPLFAGRDFDSRDHRDAPAAAIVNSTLAAKFWPGEDPLGKRLRVKGAPRWLTVVGVAGDTRHRSLTEPPRPQLYATHEQDPRIFACVIARTAGEPRALAGAVRQAIWSVDPDQPMWKVVPLAELVERSRGPARATTLVVGVVALVALLLVAVGLYGVMSYLVAQRTQEIGIRMALGARAGEVVRLVVGRGLRLTLVAVGVGILGAAALSRALVSLLVGVKPLDLSTFLAATAILTVVSLLATYLPARRAARLDPVEALAEN